MTTNNTKHIKPHWWRKSIAGLVLGYTLALGLAGLFAWYGPGGIAPGNKTQFNMWIIAPMWMLIFSLSFLFKTGNRALIWLTIANIATFGLLNVTRVYLA